MIVSRLRVKALSVAFAAELVLLAAGFALYAWLGSALSGGAISSMAAFQLIIAMLVTVLVVPVFVGGYLTAERGFLYGLALGLLPTIMAAVSSEAGGMYVLLVVYLLISGLSGVGGQSFARWRHAA